MSKYIVVTFPDETSAYRGVSALDKLHADGAITLYATTVVQRGADGKITTKDRTSVEGIEMGVGALMGALIGAFAGPVGVALGTAAGTAVGGVGGAIHGDFSDEFLEDVTKELKPGTCSVLAEISEPWAAPVDTQMAALGGKVLRERRADVIGEVMDKRAQARRVFFDDKKTAHQSHKAKNLQTKLELEIAEAADKLQRTADKARDRLAETKQELDAKVNLLEDQASKASPDVKKQIDARIAEIRRELDEREQKLYRAYEVAAQALQ